eukprot:1546396-Pleurochrysis_carterae.AAC.1
MIAHHTCHGSARKTNGSWAFGLPCKRRHLTEEVGWHHTCHGSARKTNGSLAFGLPCKRRHPTEEVGWSARSRETALSE